MVSTIQITHLFTGKWSAAYEHRLDAIVIFLMNKGAEMNGLTDSEISKYERPRNKDQGVDAITVEHLQQINLDEVRDVVKKGDRILTTEGTQIYKLDRFTPRSGSYAFKPSFAGRQVLLGKEGRELYFSNGRWFASSL